MQTLFSYGFCRNENEETESVEDDQKTCEGGTGQADAGTGNHATDDKAAIDQFLQAPKWVKEFNKTCCKLYIIFLSDDETQDDSLENSLKQADDADTIDELKTSDNTSKENVDNSQSEKTETQELGEWMNFKHFKKVLHS